MSERLTADEERAIRERASADNTPAGYTPCRCDRCALLAELDAVRADLATLREAAGSAEVRGATWMQRAIAAALEPYSTAARHAALSLSPAAVVDDALEATRPREEG